MRGLLLGIVLALRATAVLADADVQLSTGGLLSIHAEGVSLHEILDCVEERTGMKTIYDGPPPEQPLSVDLDGLTPPAAIVQLLEGRGVRFALATDRLGARVVTLLLTTAEVAIPVPPEGDLDMMSMAEPMGGETSDETASWVPERPAWWPQPGEGGAEGPGGAMAGHPVPPPGSDPEQAPPGFDPDQAPPPPPPVATAPPSNLMPTPVPYSVSPFTPQGPGPIIFAPPGYVPPTPAPTEVPPPPL